MSSDNGSHGNVFVKSCSFFLAYSIRFWAFFSFPTCWRGRVGAKCSTIKLATITFPRAIGGNYRVPLFYLFRNILWERHQTAHKHKYIKEIKEIKGIQGINRLREETSLIIILQLAKTVKTRGDSN